MKKAFSLFLVCCLLFALAACSASQAPAQTETQPKDNRFRVGYARENITPSTPVGLTGYGNTSERIYKNVLDFIYLTCVAITDADDNTVLLFTVDMGNMLMASSKTIRTKASSVTGVPVENITVSSTHSHSVPEFGAVSSLIISGTEKAAKAAMEDREYADMYIGDTNTVGLNFVRHYVMDDGSVVGDNFGDPTGKTYVSHTTEADSQLQLMQFKRDGGKKDVILANWQSHPHITGGFSKYDLSADIVGAFREYMEKETCCLFAYYQGAAGNINPTSKIAGENANTSNPRNYRLHGELLTGHAKEALAAATPLEPGVIKVHTEDFVADYFHGDGELTNYASLVIAYYDEGHTPAETKKYAEQYGIHSIFHARAISNRSVHGQTGIIPITTIQIGSVGLATIPGELFDTCGVYIKENSPYDMTFVMGYCNDSVGYLPSEFAFGHGSYEVDISNFAPGTAEKLAQRHVELLKQLKGE